MAVSAWDDAEALASAASAAGPLSGMELAEEEAELAERVGALVGQAVRDADLVLLPQDPRPRMKESSSRSCRLPPAAETSRPQQAVCES